MIAPARRMERLSTQYFASLNARIAALQAAGQDVIRLDIGSPDLPPAPEIIAALAKNAADPHQHGYQDHRASPDLRAAWAGLYQRLHGVTLDPERGIIPLLGSKEGIFHFTLALIDPGDVILIPDPAYLTYAQSAWLAGGEPYFLPLVTENGYLPELEAIPPDILRRSRMLWLNYPNNPTAATASLEFFSQAVEFASKHGLLLCHDAAYGQVTFDGYHAPSILEIPGAQEIAVEFNTLSKSHNMAGWRVGAAVGNSTALEALFRLKTNADSSHFAPILAAAVQAMNGDQAWLVERNAVYQRRRDLVMATLHSLDLQAATPQASLYVWIHTPPGMSGEEFASRALECAQISLTPGIVFGEQGRHFIRMALTESIERIADAMQRLSQAKFW